MSSTTLAGPRVNPRTRAGTARPAAIPSVMHLDGGRRWGAAQDQLRLLMRELAVMNIRQLCICPEGSPLQERLTAEGLPVRAIGWRGNADARAVIGIARNLRHFHLIHTHDSRALTAAIAPALFLNTPIIASRRSTAGTAALKWNRASRVIAISNAVRDRLVKSGVDGSRIRLVYPGVDIQEVRALPRCAPTLREITHASPQDFVAVCVGALTKDRNQALIAEVATHTPGVHWAIAGDGPARKTIEAAIATHGVDRVVHLLGTVVDARRVMLGADMFVLPATGEGFGVSLLDAMAAGIPVIAADNAGPGEILEPVHAETDASLFMPGDARAAGELLLRIRSDHALRDRIVIAQNRRVDEFRSEKTAMRTMEVYREVLR